MENGKKNLAQIIVLLLLIGATFYILLRNEDLKALSGLMRQADKGFLVLACIAASGRILGEAASMYSVFRALRMDITFAKCIKYAMIGFYFCAITPSATGGQPAQLYYMKREKIGLARSGSALVALTIAYKLVLLLFGAGVFLLFPRAVYLNMGKTAYLFYFAMAANVFLVCFFTILLFSGRLVQEGVRGGVALADRLHLLKNRKKLIQRCQSFAERYHEGAGYLKQHPGALTAVFFFTLLQRTAMFAVTYFVYRAFGLSGSSFWQIVFLQSAVAICADIFPLPGGVGISEKCYISVFSNIFSARYVLPSMLLSRGIGFYTLVLLSGMTVCYVHFRFFHEAKGCGQGGG